MRIGKVKYTWKDDLYQSQSVSAVKPQNKIGRKWNAVERDCKYCGRRHAMKKELCPAWGKTCSKCTGKNHFAIKCRVKLFHRIINRSVRLKKRIATRKVIGLEIYRASLVRSSNVNLLLKDGLSFSWSTQEHLSMSYLRNSLPAVPRLALTSTCGIRLK